MYRKSALASRRCEAEWAFDGESCRGCAAPCDLQTDEENDGVDEAMDGTAHCEDGRLETDGQEAHRGGEHVSGRDARAQLPKDDGDLRKRNGEIGKHDGGDLIGTAAESAGTELHRFRNDVADAERHVTDVEAGGDGEGGIAGEAGDGGSDTEGESAGESGIVGWTGLLIARSIGAACACSLAADAIVLGGQRSTAETAALEGWLRWIFSGGELRRVGHAMALLKELRWRVA